MPILPNGGSPLNPAAVNDAREAAAGLRTPMDVPVGMRSGMQGMPGMPMQQFTRPGAPESPEAKAAKLKMLLELLRRQQGDTAPGY